MRSLMAVKVVMVSQASLKLAYRAILLELDVFVRDAAPRPERDDPWINGSFRPIAGLHYLLSIIWSNQMGFSYCH